MPTSISNGSISGMKMLLKYGGPTESLAQVQGVQDQRIEGTEQDGRGRHHQEQIVQQQEGLARQRRETILGHQLGRAPGIQGQGATHHHRDQGQHEDAAARIGGEGMHRDEHAGAHQEGAEQAQGECGDGEQARSSS